MSKRRELRRLLFQCRAALPAKGGNEELVEQIDQYMTILGGERSKEMRPMPPKRGEPPVAMVQLKLFPFTEEVCYNNLMFQSGEQLWSYLMEQADRRPAFQQVVKEQRYVPPREIAAFLAAGGKVQRVLNPGEAAAARKRASKSLEEMGL